MERLGWVESWWEDAWTDGPRRRFCKLTGDGADHARQALRQADEARARWRLRWAPATGIS